MPVKFIVKHYVSGGVYHIYNKGVGEIFLDLADYEKFVDIMRSYAEKVRVDKKEGFKGERPYRLRHRQNMNLDGEVWVLAYCLMPDHFHLLIKQDASDGITKYMRRVATSYVMYFNKKYSRRGSPFEGIYKGMRVDEHNLLSISRHIHLNPGTRRVVRFGPVETVTGSRPEEYPHSSYQQYLGRGEVWVRADQVLGEMHPGEDYRRFVELGMKGVVKERWELD